MCHVHINASVDGQLNGALAQTPILSLGIMGDQIDQLTSELEAVFPDIEIPITPLGIRTQAVGIIHSTVSSEVYRHFPSIDGTPYDKRNELIFAYHQNVIDSVHSQLGEQATSDNAILYADSSIDEYGRGPTEGSVLIGYALRKEWELAKIQGSVADHEGIHYGDHPDDFVTRCVPFVVSETSNEYLRMIHSYGSIVAEVTGQGPRTQPMPAESIPRSRIDMVDTPGLENALNQGNILSHKETVAARERIQRERQMQQDEVQSQILLKQQRERAERNKQMAMSAFSKSMNTVAAIRSRPKRPKISSEERIRQEENEEMRKAALKRARNYNKKAFFWD